MDATHFIHAAILFTVLHAGAAIKCYECDSQKQVQCSGGYSPRKSYLKDSGKDPGATCYELSTRDPNGTIFFQRGIISRFKEDKYTRLCLGAEDIFPRIGDGVTNRNYSSPKRTNASSPAEDAFHKLQASASRTNPSAVLKGGDEQDENTRIEATYNCTTCIKDLCNWKTLEDYSDLPQNTDDEEEDYDLSTVTELVPRTTVPTKEKGGSAKLSSHLAAFLLPALLFICLS